MTSLKSSRYTIKGADCLILTFSGVMDLSTLEQQARAISEEISIDFDGYVIFDMREVNDLLTNDDAEALLNKASPLRYFFRKPTAVLIDSSVPVNRSRKYYQSLTEREGLVFRDFVDLDDAVAWLLDPDDL